MLTLQVICCIVLCIACVVLCLFCVAGSLAGLCIAVSTDAMGLLIGLFSSVWFAAVAVVGGMLCNVTYQMAMRLLEQ